MTQSPFAQNSGGAQSPFSQANASPFGDPAPNDTTALSTTTAPVARLVPSLVMGVISVVISLVLFFSSTTATDSSYLPLTMAAWVLAGVLGIGALGVYFKGDADARASGMFVSVGWKEALYWATIVVLGLGVLLSAIHAGLYVGKNF